MSTATDAHDTDPHAGDHADHIEGDFEHAHKPDSWYVKIAIILAVITGFEVMLKYVSIGSLFLPVLFILMAIKFVMVVLFFMHLRFDSKWFNMAFWLGLGLAVFVYCGALATFKFWSS
jgi:cytochrome c oxidase subunit IV